MTVTATSEDVPVRYVTYRDLNLVLAADEQRLVRRVRYAAKEVCTESVQGELSYTTVFMKCRSNAWQGAAPQIERAVTRARDMPPTVGARSPGRHHDHCQRQLAAGDRPRVKAPGRISSSAPLGAVGLLVGREAARAHLAGIGLGRLADAVARSS